MRYRMIIAASLIIGLVSAPSANAGTYSGIVVFGDSLSDDGPADGYGLRVSSNGRVWADYLAERLGVALLDMAYSSAETDYHPATDSAKWGFCWQIDEYLHTKGPASGDKLYIVWIGGNDLLKRAGDPRVAIEKAVTNIAYGIERLIGAGAKHLLVMNLPNLGLTPMMNGRNLDKNGQGLRYRLVDNPIGGAEMAAAFNKSLRHVLVGYRQAVNLIEVDVFGLTNQFVADGVFDNAIHMLMVNQPTDETYMFWDTHHPTDDAHRLIAGAVYRALTRADQPAASFPTAPDDCGEFKYLAGRHP